MMSTVPQRGIGNELAARLRLEITGREGHDLVGPCVHCPSRDAFRLHAEKGIAQCYSCRIKLSPFQLAMHVLSNGEDAKSLMVELGLFQQTTRDNGKPQAPPLDPITMIARQKHVSVDSLKAYGARVTSKNSISVPAYGTDGKQCTTMSLSTTGGKGKFEYGKPAGLFFPHDENGVRLPKLDETWHIVEGPKDAAALHGMGLLAVGLNGCQLAPQFARLFAGVNVIPIPDRDEAGEKGAKKSARALHGFAKSVRIAVLPAEFKKSGGDDVRDVLRQRDGRQLVEQAIADAKLFEISNDSIQIGDTAAANIDLPDGELLTLTVSQTNSKSQRLIVAQQGDFVHRDRINTDSDSSRTRFINKLASKLDIESAVLAPLVEPKLMTLADQVGHQTKHGTMPGDEEQHSQATIAAQIAEEWELWHTPDNVAYVTILVDDHKENWRVRSRTLRRYLDKRFYEECGTAIHSNARCTALDLVEAKALIDGEEHEVHVRVAEHDGNVYLDLCNNKWRVVEVTPNGRQVIDEPPVKFRRSPGMLPLPEPQLGGTVDGLRRFLNVDFASWVLVVAFLIACLRLHGPFPILLLVAEQGTGKSTLARIIRALIDPNSAPIRSEPRNSHDLMIAANNSWLLFFDNLSHLPRRLSDALCRLSTGGGFATRQLYSDQDEVIFDSQRPVLLTSIEDVATRSDLLDRCLIIPLPTIPENNRRTEAELVAKFQSARPHILGALLDALSGALRDLPNTKLSSLPRMADFALFATAAEKTLGWPPGTFMTAYRENQSSANDLAVESSPVGRPLLDLLEERRGWRGTAGELLEALEAQTADQAKKPMGWPKSAQLMANELKRLSPNLRVAGWEIERKRKANERLWIIQRIEKHASLASLVSQTGPHRSSEGNGNLVQIDANSCEQQIDDADDADDANTGTFSHEGDPNREGDNVTPV